MGFASSIKKVVATEKKIDFTGRYQQGPSPKSTTPTTYVPGALEDVTAVKDLLRNVLAALPQDVRASISKAFQDYTVANSGVYSKFLAHLYPKFTGVKKQIFEAYTAGGKSEAVKAAVRLMESPENNFEQTIDKLLQTLHAEGTWKKSVQSIATSLKKALPKVPAQYKQLFTAAIQAIIEIGSSGYAKYHRNQFSIPALRALFLDSNLPDVKTRFNFEDFIRSLGVFKK